MSFYEKKLPFFHHRGFRPAVTEGSDLKYSRAYSDQAGPYSTRLHKKKKKAIFFC